MNLKDGSFIDMVIALAVIASIIIIANNVEEF